MKMHYLYAVSNYKFALVAKSEDLVSLNNKMDVEKQCWSDEGISYILTDREIAFTDYDTMMQDHMK